MISQHIKKNNQKVFSGTKYIRLSVGLSPANPLLILQVQVKDFRKINRCDNRRRPYPNCQRSHWDASEWWSGQSIEWASQSSMLIKRQYNKPKVTKIVPVSVHSPWGHEDNAKIGQGHHPWFGRFFFFGVFYNFLNCFFLSL